MPNTPDDRLTASIGAHMGCVVEPEELFWRFAGSVLDQLREEAEHLEVEELEEWLYSDGPTPACVRRYDSYA